MSAAALAAALTVSACGSSHAGAIKTTRTQPPIHFSVGQTIPTSTVPQPSRHATLGPEGVPLETGPVLAPADTTQLGTPADGVLCQQLQQLAYRSYSRLHIFVRGHSRELPGGIGMVTASARAVPGGLLYTASTCYYWLHTRTDDGVIEVESPARRTFTLGDFFAVWDQPLSATDVAGARGRVSALVNGRLWRGSLDSIPLRARAQVELAVGRPVPRERRIDWAAAHI